MLRWWGGAVTRITSQPRQFNEDQYGYEIGLRMIAVADTRGSSKEAWLLEPVVLLPQHGTNRPRNPSSDAERHDKPSYSQPPQTRFYQESPRVSLGDPRSAY